jgi:hypothetical protein
LPDPRLSTAARNSLENIPDALALRGLRKSLPSLQGLQKVGVIQSLGSRRDAGSVGALAGLLRQPDTESAAAAAHALGEIGNVSAGKALMAFLPSAPAAIRRDVVGAGLACAELLVTEGRPAEARHVYEALASASEFPHIQEAARRGLKRC